MRIFSGGAIGSVYTLRLDAGDDLLACIEAFIKQENIVNGVVLSAIGTLDYCVLHMVMTTGYPPVEHFARWENQPLELSSVSGVIAKGVPHLHAVVSDHERAYSGHLEPGCRILYLGEVVIAQTEGFSYARVKNERGIGELRELP